MNIHVIKPTSSLLTWLRHGGVLMCGNFKIRSAQTNRAIVLFKNDVWQNEFEFSNAGLFLAIAHIQESDGS